MRADSGFYTHAVVSACRETNVRYSITVRQHKSLRNLIEAIPEGDWTPIPLCLDFGDGAERGRMSATGIPPWTPPSPPSKPVLEYKIPDC